jgi:CHRD domain
MKLRFAALTIVAGACLAAVGPLEAKTIHFTAALNGASEVPPNTTAGTGEVKADLDTVTKVFSYNVTYSGLTGPAVAAHFHGPAAPGVNAPPVITMKDLASPIAGTAVLSAPEMSDLQGGKWYFNVHTKAHPGGEIRGQLAAQ